LSGSWASVASTPPAPFTVNGSPFGPIPPGKTQSIAVTFAPTLKGKATPVGLTITSTGVAPGTATVTLGGVGK